MMYLDFDIESLVYNTLSPLNLPLFNTKADLEENENTFIVFQEYNNEDGLIYDNLRRLTKFTVLVKIYSYDDLFEINRKVETLMQKAGFLRISKKRTGDVELECYATIYRFEYIAPTTIINNNEEGEI